MMLLRGKASKCLVVCCVLVVLTMARGKDRPTTGGCNSVLTISAETQSNSEGNGNIHTRSLSPWTWTPTTVENRIPSTIWEAECSTSYCSYPSPSQQEGPSQHNVVPIHQQLLVLTRKGRERCYTASYLTVAVGCTCVLMTA